ncbi:hypothetical protein PTTG_08196 [Puccinia triticina 1-1 BBBD Race 1]|uniref:Myb-like domain-containing protein n=2 Tax=Puccinia triticina TaxID=208348 RepID=A0A180G7C0_PUCT1|nr:uncharacterized protein PtA15_16A207 [Puccinia triticina]OAV88379.1 hypothetical protein PTTG_08196 [Puccinia triticina 1-1 BBBD Race 1]WAQ92301.1 hypothetical protein PtA15_16A207 [Puccinia triticina]WAR64038.1 hypothetical protein PtB15_16B197 [Puccinia triticina]
MATPSAGPDDTDNGSKESFWELAKQIQATRKLIITSRAEIEKSKSEGAYLLKKIEVYAGHTPVTKETEPAKARRKARPAPKEPKSTGMGCYSKAERAVILGEIEKFCVSEKITSSHLWLNLSQPRTASQLISNLSAKLPMRKDESIVKKLQELCQNPDGVAERAIWTEEEDVTLIKALNQERFVLMDGKRDHERVIWSQIAEYCKGEDPSFNRNALQCQKRWLQERNFQGKRAGSFLWKDVEFYVFNATYLQKCWDKLSTRYKKADEDFETFFQRTIDEHADATSAQLNKKIYGGGHHNFAVLDHLGKTTKRKGYKEPPRY